MTIKLIMFDIGGVLIDFTEQQYLEYLHETVMPEVPEIELERFVMPLMVLLDYGTLDAPKLEQMVGKHFGIKNLDMHWVKGWRRLAKPKMDVINLANELSKDYRTVLLSNISFSRGAEVKEMIGKVLSIKTVYRSCDLRMRKPGPNIYEYVLKKEGVKPSEAVFIDNQIDNVLGAEEVGIHAIWFRDYDLLLKDLKKLGVLE